MQPKIQPYYVVNPLTSFAFQSFFCLFGSGGDPRSRIKCASTVSTSPGPPLISPNPWLLHFASVPRQAQWTRIAPEFRILLLLQLVAV